MRGFWLYGVRVAADWYWHTCSCFCWLLRFPSPAIASAPWKPKKEGKRKRTTLGFTMHSTVNGPTKRGANFLDSTLRGRSLARNHTCLTRLIDRCRSPVVVGLSRHSLSSTKKGCSCGPPGILAPPNHRLDGEDIHFLLLGGEQRGLISKRALKRWKANGSIGQGIMCILYPGQSVTQGRGVLRDHAV